MEHCLLNKKITILFVERNSDNSLTILLFNKIKNRQIIAGFLFFLFVLFVIFNKIVIIIVYENF